MVKVELRPGLRARDYSLDGQILHNIGGAEPFWLDLPVSIEAAALRQNLQARHPPAARSRMTVLQPNWTLGTGTASVSGSYRLVGRRGTVETGVLSVQLARRGEHWRIAQLHLEPAR